MKIIKWLDKNLEVALMIISLLVIVFVMGAQVVARKCLGMSIEWSEELGRYLFVWMGFLSISYTIHAKSIIRLEIFNAILRPGYFEGYRYRRTDFYAGHIRIFNISVPLDFKYHRSALVQH